MTHKGAAADSGHYIGFVKKNVFHAAKAKTNTNAIRSDPAFNYLASTAISRVFSEHEQGANGPTDSHSAPVSGPSSSSTLIIDDQALALEDDEDWYKFDDEKVTDFPKEKLPTLEGGGEDSTAYVLLYKSKVL